MFDASRLPTVTLLALLATGSAPALAQEIAVRPQLHAGDQFRLDVTCIRENSGRPQQDGRSTTPVDVRVMTATSDAVTLDWTPGATRFDNPQMAQNPLLLAAATALAGLVLRLQLDADGRYSGLVNEAAVVPKLRATVDVLTGAMATKLNEEQRQPFLAIMGQRLSPAVLVASATREAQIYFGLNGLSLTVGARVETTMEQPNPLGAGGIPGMVTVRVESAAADSAVLATTTVFDAETLRQITVAFIEQSGRPVPPEVVAKLPPLDIRDEGRYIFDRSLGLMREVAVNRRMSAGANERLDGWEFRLADPPGR